MRISQLFTKTRKEAPKDEVAKNAELLVRAGYIHKEMAGVYTFLPLGLRVLKNIENVIREEMNAIGGQEVLMTTLQCPDVWQKSGRWDDEVVDNWFKTSLKGGTELGLANTHEEPLTEMLKQFISSYKDLPLYIYQIQTKFRNELRAKSGIMRLREFIMKDMYSFSRKEEEFREFYEKCAETYMKIFTRLGIGEQTYRTFASGGSFSKFSDEFQTVSEAGEDAIYIDKAKKIAVNKEVYTDDVLDELGLEKNKLQEACAIEVGNIFPLGTRFSESLGLTYSDEEGNQHNPVMGSYGTSPNRLMGTVAEVLSDERGLVWPEEIAPYQYHLLSLGGDKAKECADTLYRERRARGRDNILYDDRDVSAGVKFADAELMGIPTALIVSDKTIEKGEDVVEIKDRKTGDCRDGTVGDLK
jgi:prolyl-tRNA synthetase